MSIPFSLLSSFTFFASSGFAFSSHINAILHDGRSSLILDAALLRCEEVYGGVLVTSMSRTSARTDLQVLIGPSLLSYRTRIGLSSLRSCIYMMIAPDNRRFCVLITTVRNISSPLVPLIIYWREYSNNFPVIAHHPKEYFSCFI